MCRLRRLFGKYSRQQASFTTTISFTETWSRRMYCFRKMGSLKSVISDGQEQLLEEKLKSSRLMWPPDGTEPLNCWLATKNTLKQSTCGQLVAYLWSYWLADHSLLLKRIMKHLSKFYLRFMEVKNFQKDWNNASRRILSSQELQYQTLLST